MEKLDEEENKTSEVDQYVNNESEKQVVISDLGGSIKADDEIETIMEEDEEKEEDTPLKKVVVKKANVPVLN
jgi:hypothetical protein